MNLLKAIGSLGGGTAQGDGQSPNAEKTDSPPSSAPPYFEPQTPAENGSYNFMQKILERHEEISNRIKRR